MVIKLILQKDPNGDRMRVFRNSEKGNNVTDTSKPKMYMLMAADSKIEYI